MIFNVVRVVVTKEEESVEECWVLIGPSRKYAVSTFGRVWSIDTRCFIVVRQGPTGYAYVYYEKKCHSVHRLVATAFYDRNSPDQIWVDHKDLNRLNNRVGNLRWCTPQQNLRNVRQRNKTGYAGTFEQSNGSFYALANGRHIGRFESAEDCMLAKARFEERIHGEFLHKDLKALLDANRARAEMLLPNEEIARLSLPRKKRLKQVPLKYVTRRANGKFTARIRVEGKCHTTGTFHTAEEAHQSILAWRAARGMS